MTHLLTEDFMNFVAYFFTAFFSLSTFAMEMEDAVIEMKESGINLSQALERLRNLEKPTKKKNSVDKFDCSWGDFSIVVCGVGFFLPASVFGLGALLEWFELANRSNAILFGSLGGGVPTVAAAGAGLFKISPKIRQWYKEWSSADLRALIKDFSEALDSEGDRSLNKEEVINFLPYALWSDLKLFSCQQAKWIFEDKPEIFDEVADHLMTSKTIDNGFNHYRIYHHIKEQIKKDAESCPIDNKDLALIQKNDFLGAKITKLLGGGA